MNPDPTNRTLNYDNDGDYWLADERRIDERRAMPDPDPTNRETLLIAAFRGKPFTAEQVLEARRILDALDADGYQIVPKVELEGLRRYIEVVQRKGVGCQDAEYRSALQALDKENG